MTKILEGDIERDMTDEEIATNELILQGVTTSIATEAEAAAIKSAARQAVLDKLGLTADEVQLLLGGI